FGKIGTNTPFKTPEPRQNKSETARNAAKSPENAPLARARAHADERRHLAKGRLPEGTKEEETHFPSIFGLT
ncbi:MAG: hypothetical protein MR894_06150, partial [Akkermansia muciniphila]|nr:hypothetical protein [Akkermansia muciniphila]